MDSRDNIVTVPLNQSTEKFYSGKSTAIKGSCFQLCEKKAAYTIFTEKNRALSNVPKIMIYKPLQKTLGSSN
ncbi:hypothetical protein Murru_2546 [Allomuricauda ruestringensis DSM 13258]|uniref:Uncharacterized protein n=1 Tax=Allomuricauda ruestringensis (strain DSM 13258 / CIP 107369 / LMG 19739 / B1) TaxID=886377 RepID=G2PQ76_ALLRU|nr:hypothetical protein Murru_2546 [Allomuricauda ruestringensis DSM 13258]